MSRSREAQKRNRLKKRHRERYDSNPEEVTHYTGRLTTIPTIIPERYCEHCVTAAADRAGQDNFDEHGYPIQKTVNQAGLAERTANVVNLLPEKVQTPFRFLDLPAEVRNNIYELVVSTAAVVCVPDRLLRPSEDLSGSTEVLRKCTKDLICLPCQLHNILQTSDIGLSRANKQLHNEMALIPYTITAFSLHNLYYLQTFLSIVGKPGRKALRSLRFEWKLPEEEAHALQMYTNVYEVYNMLLECSCLKELGVNIDVVNLLSWRGNGNPRSEMLSLLQELPSIELMYGLRGLRDVTISWKDFPGLGAMEEWARWIIGLWRLPHGVGGENAVSVSEDDSAVECDWPQRCIVWRVK